MQHPQTTLPNWLIILLLVVKSTTLLIPHYPHDSLKGSFSIYLPHFIGAAERARDTIIPRNPQSYLGGKCLLMIVIYSILWLLKLQLLYKYIDCELPLQLLNWKRKLKIPIVWLLNLTNIFQLKCERIIRLRSMQYLCVPTVTLCHLPASNNSSSRVLQQWPP